MKQAKNVDEYVSIHRAAVASNPECGTSRYNLAVGLMGQKNYDEAEEEFLDAIHCSPNLAEAYVQLGGLCLMRGDLDGCLRYNQQSVKVRAGFSEGYGNIGFLHLQKGNIEDAITALEKAIAYNSSYLQAHANLANAYLMKGMIDKSIQTSLKVIELEPSFAIAHNNLAIAYLEKGEKEPAKTHCEKAVSLGYEVAPEILKELEG